MNKLPPLLALSLLCGTAAAEPEILSSNVVGDQVEMTIAGARAFRPDEFALRDASEPRSAAVRATTVRAYEDGRDPIAIAVVYQGGEVWIGNDNIVPDDDAGRFFGALPGVQSAVDLIGHRRFPQGSEGVVITYDDRAAIRVPIGAIDRLSAESIGSQKDYYNHLGTELVSGVDLAMRELERSHAAMKALIVIGDGNDTNNEAAKAQLTALKKRAAQANIKTLGVIYKGMLSDPGNVVSALDPQTRTVNTTDGIAGSIDAFLDRITDRTEVAFPAPWTDGKSHEVIAQIGRDDLSSEYVTAPYHATSRFHWLAGYWQQLFAGFALVGLLALGLKLGHRGAKDL